MIDRFRACNANPVLARVGRSAGIVAPPFVAGIGVLALSLLGVVDLGSRVVERDLLILNLLLYWVVVAVVLAVIRDCSAVHLYLGRRIAPIILASASLALAVTIAEYAARAFVERTEGFQLLFSAELHHKNPSNASLRDNTGASVHTNEDGLRTGWTRTALQERNGRVAVLGDSFVFGLGVDDEKTAPFVLERMLRDRLRTDDLGVLNAGVISYSPLLERSAFRRIVRDDRPTLTILVLDLGDIGDDYAYAADIVPGSDPSDPRFSPGAWTSGSRSALVKLAEPILAPLYVPGDVLRRVTNRPRRRRGYRDFEITIGNVVEKDRWFILRHPLEATRPYFEASVSYIEDIANDAGSRFAAESLADVVLDRGWRR